MYEGGKLTELNLNEILPNRFQPRILFDELKLTELAKSIRKHGIIQPIVVRPINNKYEIIAGERRYKASLIAGKMTIPAIVVAMNDKDAEEIALLENVQRQPLSPIEEAVSFKRILDNGYITGAELSEKIGKSQTYIAKKVSLLNLDDIVQEALLNNKISERHARSLLKIQNSDDQVAMLNRIINERLTVKMADKEIRNYHNKQTNAPTPHIMATIIPQNIKVEDNLFTNDKPLKIKEERENKMDIDKIMNEAKDINSTPQVNDISDLMKGAPMPAENQFQNQTPQTEPALAVTQDNKFVNFVPNTPAPQTNTNTNTNSNFNSIFNQTPSTSAPVEPAPVTTPSPAPTEALFGNIQTPTLENTSIEPQTISSPFGNAPTPATREFQNQTPQTQETTVPPIEPINPTYHTIGTNDFQNIPPQTIENSYAQTQNTITPNIEPNTINNELNSAPTFTINQNIPETPQSNSFSAVINLIRECSDKIEKLGYFIDVDEMDLGDNYQVTFKINK